jgi:hypothetical protein
MPEARVPPRGQIFLYHVTRSVSGAAGHDQIMVQRLPGLHWVNPGLDGYRDALCRWHSVGRPVDGWIRQD